MDSNKKNVSKKSLIIMTILFLFILMSVGNRLAFGVWNPFSLPEKIDCYGRRYHISNFSPKTIGGNKEPKYELKFWDSWSGKALYMIEEKDELVPTVIYLKMLDGKYQIYELSGGQ